MIETTTVTKKELELIKAIVDHNEYGERGCLNNSPWTWAICGSKSKGAVLGSLVNKGLIFQGGTGDDSYCRLTEAGKKVYLDSFGSDGVQE